MLAIWISCNQSHNYPECLRLLLRDFRFCQVLIVTRALAFGFRSTPKIPDACQKKPQVPRVSYNIKQPFEKSKKIHIWASVEFHVLFSVGFLPLAIFSIVKYLVLMWSIVVSIVAVLNFHLLLALPTLLEFSPPTLSSSASRISPFP